LKPMTIGKIICLKIMIIDKNNVFERK
jgi:hypothetical protein